MTTTISITVERREDSNKIAAHLTKFGQVKTVGHGSPDAYVYQPVERLRDPEGRTVSVKSKLCKVSRALVDLPSGDYLGLWDFITTCEKEEIMTWLAKRKAEELKKILQEIEMFHQV